jgi:hypothetical protein
MDEQGRDVWTPDGLPRVGKYIPIGYKPTASVLYHFDHSFSDTHFEGAVCHR